MELGNLWFDTHLKNTAVQDAENIKKELTRILDASLPINIKVQHSNIDGVRQQISAALLKNDFKIKVNVDTASLLNIQKLNGLTEAQAKLAEVLARVDLLEKQIAADRQYTMTITTRLSAAENELLHARNKLNNTLQSNTKNALQFQSSLSKGLSVTSRMGDAMVGLYSVYKAREFLQNVIEIGGQLEQQRISIGAILGDVARANTLFNQIKSLAVKSPFGVVELDQYTKQLSAYGFQANELFDMTKRLADISAGAGQDIGRLALALGHVRSATYLTGITLRQFSMNNIPMLRMLSEYYTELEGKIVSTAEVQKRISERKVSYEDVIEQIKRMTNEGGMFYNMQEKVSESLNAKFKNLADAFSIMYGEIAESSLGDALKEVAETITALVKEWRPMVAEMGFALTYFAGMRLAALAYAKGQQLAAASTTQATTAITVQASSLSYLKTAMVGATAAIKGLWAALKSNVYSLAIFAVFEIAINWLMKYSEESREAEERTRSLYNTAIEGYRNLKKATDSFSKDVAKSLTTDELKHGIDEMMQTIVDYAPNAADIIKEASGIENLSDKYDFLKKKLDETTEAYEHLKDIRDVFETANEGTDGGWLDKSFTQNAENWAKMTNEEEKALTKLGNYGMELEDVLAKARQSDKKFAAAMRNEDGSVKTIEEQIEAIHNFKDAYSLFFKEVSDYNKADIWGNGTYIKLNQAIEEYHKKSKAVRDIWKGDLTTDAQKLAQSLTTSLTSEWGEGWKQNASKLQAAAMMIRNSLNSLNGITPEQLEQLASLLGGYMGIPLSFKKGELPTNGNDNNNDNNKKDTELERAKTRLDEIKSFYSEYKKFRELYSKEEAINILEPLFPNMNVSGQDVVDNYMSVLDRVVSEIGGGLTTEARKKFDIEVRKLQSTVTFDNLKKDVDNKLKDLDNYLKSEGKKYDLFKSVLQSTGNKSIAAAMAFDGSMEFDNYAEMLRSELEAALKESNIDKTVAEVLSMSEDELDNLGIKGTTKKLVDSLRDETEDVRKEQIKLWQEAYKNAYEYDLELEKINSKYDQMREAAEAMRDNVGNEKTDQILVGIDKKQAKETSDLLWKQFKETEEWGRVFSDLDNMSSTTLNNMLNKLRDYAPTVEGSVESTKALYEAMQKISDLLQDRNPFASLVDSLRSASRLREEISKYQSFDPYHQITFSAAKAGQLGLTDGTKEWKGTLTELRDNLQNAENKFVKSISGIANKFKAVQDVLQPVIDLFEQLGNTTLSDLFKMGSNAIGSAASVASGIQSIQGLFNEDSPIYDAIGKAGPWGAAVGAGLSLISSISAMHDASLQKEIEASEARQKEMENLSKNLETVLDRAINGILGTKADGNTLSKLAYYAEKYAAANKANPKTSSQFMDKLNFSYISRETNNAVKQALQSKNYYDSVYASMLAQRDELAHQLELEKDKKKSDKSKIADFEQAMTEINDQIKYFATDMMKDLYEIDFKSWAQSLSEVLVDAWASGEDAAESYRDKVSEILRDLGVKMIAERFVADKLNPIMEQFIRQYEQDKGVLTTDGMAILGGMYDAAYELQEQTTNFLNGLNEVAMQHGEELKETNAASSGLSKSIEGVSENTADLLASYLNATRADVSLIAMNIPIQNGLAQSQVQHLESIARHTEAIERHTATMEVYLQNQDGIHRYVKGIADGTYKIRV